MSMRNPSVRPSRLVMLLDFYSSMESSRLFCFFALPAKARLNASSVTPVWLGLRSMFAPSVGGEAGLEPGREAAGLPTTESLPVSSSEPLPNPFQPPDRWSPEKEFIRDPAGVMTGVTSGVARG